MTPTEIEGVVQALWPVEELGRQFLSVPSHDPRPHIQDLVDQLEAGEINEAIVLTKFDSSTRWWALLIHHDPDLFCAVDHRLKYPGTKGSATFPSVIIYFGDNSIGFYKAFRHLGPIFRLYRPTRRYEIGQRLLLRTPLHFKKPAWHTVTSEANRWGIYLLQADSGAVTGLRAEEIEKYIQEAKNEHLCS